MATITQRPIRTRTVGDINVDATANTHWTPRPSGQVTVTFTDSDAVVILTHDQAHHLGLALLTGAKQAHLQERVARADGRTPAQVPVIL